MFQCHVCGSKEARQNHVNQIFMLDEKPVIVENVPAQVCVRCGEAIFDMATVEQIREMIHGKAKPVKSIMTDVFTLSPPSMNQHHHKLSSHS
jgi:YgiT-type zinc finger domain-containing protein